MKSMYMYVFFPEAARRIYPKRINFIFFVKLEYKCITLRAAMSTKLHIQDFETSQIL